MSPTASAGKSLRVLRSEAGCRAVGGGRMPFSLTPSFSHLAGNGVHVIGEPPPGVAHD